MKPPAPPRVKHCRGVRTIEIDERDALIVAYRDRAAAPDVVPAAAERLRRLAQQLESMDWSWTSRLGIERRVRK